MQNCLELPDSNLHIIPGCQVKLGRFDTTIWSVAYGWYTWGGNRPVCGWYLYNTYLSKIKPLQETDLDDIYLIESPSYPYLDNCQPPPSTHGESAYELAVKNGFEGTESEYLSSLIGADGVGISESQIDANGQLILTYTNGQSTNLGRVVGTDGQDYSLTDADKAEIANIVISEYDNLMMAVLGDGSNVKE